MKLRYGFDENRFHLRVDVFAEALQELRDAEFRITFPRRAGVARGGAL